MVKLISILVFFFLWIGQVSDLSAGEKKIKIDKVVIEGNLAFPIERLEKLMLSRTSRFLANSYYYSEILSDDIDNLLIFYQQNGYLDAKIIDSYVKIDSLNSLCEINISIDEGLITRVGEISIFGNKSFNDSTVHGLVKLKKNEPFRRNMIQEDQIALLSFYAERGYLDALVKPDIKINAETHTGFIDYIVTENACFSVGDILLNGNKKTNRNVILRELLFKSDETFKYSNLLASQRRLYSLGLFESVFISPQPNIDSVSDKKDILIDIKERQSSEFGVMVGYGSEDKARTRLEINSSNLSGTARKAGAGLSASFIRRSVEASFTDLRLFGTRWRFDLNNMFEFYEQPGYDVSRFVNIIAIGRPLGRTTYLKSSFRYEDAQLKHVEVIDSLETLEPRVRSLKLSLSHDSRDNLFDPRSGLYMELSQEIAGAFLNANNTFTRSVVKLKSFIDLNNKTIVASALEIGLIDHVGAFEEISLSERFYAGGTNSIRGFDYQMVGPLDNEGNPIGGKFQVVWNALEIRRSLYKLMGVVFFIDMGNIWPHAKDFTFRGIRISSGIGLRISSPIGILRLDYGINLDKRKGERRAVLHFNMGHSF